MKRKYNPIPFEEMSEYLEYDPTSKTALRWIKKTSPKAPINIGDEAGCLDGGGYYQFRFNGKYYGAHRIVFALCHNEDPGEMLIDHIDNIRTNNRIENLRLVNESDSIRHRGGFGKSKYKGVIHREGYKKPWYAQINLDGEKKYLGCFDTEIAAALVSSAAHIGRDGFYPWPKE